MTAHGLWWFAAIGLLAAQGPSGEQARNFDEKVAPILTRRCLGCHNHELDDGGISFEERATLLRDRGERGAAVVPGNPEKSPLIWAVRHNGEIQMPPGKKLPEQEIRILTEWIEQGAVWGSKLRQ